MKTLVTLLTTAALTLGVSITSQAADAEQVAFKYNPKASVATTYTSLKSQARKICKNELGVMMQYSGGKCINTYVTEIVGKIDRVELTAYHNQMTMPESGTIRLASLSK